MAAEIKRLCIQRFRGIRELTWRPRSGLNLLLGGGNVGKTTLLEAIGLLLNPTTSYTLADSDYFGRRIEDEFLIEAVMALPGAVNRQPVMAWPWEWDGQDAVLAGVEPPDEAAAPGDARPSVYEVRVRGTADLELVYEVVQPDDNVVAFSAGLRREMKLTPFRGHLILTEEGVRHADPQAPIPGGVPPTDGRVGASRPHADAACG